MLVFEAIAEELSRRGVRAIFSVPASETMRIIAAAQSRGIANYSARHEQVAVGMADGYFRATGEVGVVLVGRGAGLTNGTNATVTARKSNSGVLVIAGENTNALAADPAAASRHLMSMKTLDQVGYLTALGVVPAVLDSPHSAVADFGAAFDLAQGGVTVAVLIRGDVTFADAGSAERRINLPPPLERVFGGAAHDEIELIADVLGETWAVRRPLIIVGRGAIRAIPEVRRLGELTGALLSTTLLAKGAFFGDQFDLGLVGTMSTPTASGMIPDAELVLAFGASLNPFTTYGGDLLRKARVIQIDSDPGAIGVHHPVDVGIVADAKTVASQLVGELERRMHKETGWRTPDVAAAISRSDVMEGLRDQSSPGWVDPRIATILLNRALPDDCIVVVDNGAACISFGAKYLDASDPYSLLMCHQYGSVGSGFGPALGAAIANRDRTTVLCTGDGGFMMALADLDTAVRYSLPIVFYVMNDHAFGQEVHLLALDGVPDDFCRYGGPSLEEVATSFGARGITINSLSDLKGITEELDASRGPIVIDCRISLDVRGDHVDLVARLGHGQTSVAATAQ